MLRAELGQALARLGAAGVECIVLKGFPLGHRIGVPLVDRPQSDNDVLVRRRSVERAVAVLSELGYRAAPLPELRTLLDSDFQVVLHRSVGGVRVSLDLHWSPFFPTYHPVSEAVVWSHTEVVRFDRTETVVLDRLLTLLHLAAHYEQHAFCERRILDDLARAWNQWGPDLDQVDLRSFAAEIGLRHAFEFALSTAEALGLLSYPAPRWGSGRVKRLAAVLPPSELSSSCRPGDRRRTLASWLLLDPRRLPGLFARELFPHPQRLAAMTGQPMSPRLYARYATRPVCWVARSLVARGKARP
ncbi:MAG: nucleotidyltransferase family protein [Myxococcales bacterium]|nr:nucleotidyltransferase family protein [Myxococcales bacterium]